MRMTRRRRAAPLPVMSSSSSRCCGSSLMLFSTVWLLGASDVASFTAARPASPSPAATFTFTAPKNVNDRVIMNFEKASAAGATSSSLRSATESSATESASSSSASSSSTSGEEAALLSPNYEIEPIAVRIGHGFDIHRMAPIQEAGQPIVIAGVEITHKDQKWTDKEGKYTGVPGGVYETQLGVVAHSDGDVVYHSIVDAIFGALTLPDIGQVFQDTDPRWRGCDSSKFMEHAWSVMDGHGYRIGNCDVTLILERPKVATFKPAMKENIVSLLQTTPGRVNVKARTHEQVDSVGELRSLSCHVVLTLERIPEEEDKRKERKAPVFF